MHTNLFILNRGTLSLKEKPQINFLSELVRALERKQGDNKKRMTRVCR